MLYMVRKNQHKKPLNIGGLLWDFNLGRESCSSTCYCGSGVEHHLGKVGVAGPIPASSSNTFVHFSAS